MMLIQASMAILLRRMMLIASVIMVMPARGQESTIPNFTSANFGWLVNSGFDFRPVEGKVAPLGDPIHIGAAELVCQRVISTISLRKRQPVHGGRVQATPVHGSSSGFPMPGTPI
jgi:hypothetical protein